MTGRYVVTAEIKAAIENRETDILDGLGIDWRQPASRHITCPYRGHPDKNPSWRWDCIDRRAYCTCGSADILGVLMTVEGIGFEAAKLRAAELLKRPDLIRQRHIRGEGDGVSPEQPRNGATPQGLRLAEYAAAKQLPLEFLQSLGLTDVHLGSPAVRLPYRAEDGGEAAVRFRIALEGPVRFRWRLGSKALLYGLDRLDGARSAGFVCLVEGESDCHTLWHHDVPALGLPGNNQWNEARDAALLDGIGTIYVMIEPDQGGETMRERFANSSILPRVRIVNLRVKDPNELHIAVDGDRERFLTELRAALEAAEPYQRIAEHEDAVEAERLGSLAGDLLAEKDVLARFAAQLFKAGLVGEDRNAKLLYLALTTRLFDRPVSVAVKGPSSGGKSYTVEVVLRFMPESAYWTRTAMSNRALAYSDEDFRHRHLVIFEAAGMTGEIATYLIRSLLSENRICYETVEKTQDGMKPRVIKKEGPTGLITTTTAVRLHPENETRLLSLVVKDTPDQTSAESAGEKIPH
jgi:hypothetical protein